MPDRTACCAHDHDCGEQECGPSYSLYKHVDTARVTCLNECTEGSCKGVFKEWSQRTDRSGPALESHADDPELLLYVPFSGSIKLKAICIVGGDDGTAPATLKVFINRDDLDFGTANDSPPVQEWALQQDPTGIYEYPTQLTEFAGVHSITMHFPDTHGAEHSRIHFIGFKGEFTDRRREAVSTVYEVRPVAEGSKTLGTMGGAAIS